MNDMRKLALLSLTAFALASADTVTLKNGRVMNGTYLGGTAREIRLDMGDHVETIPVERVSTVQFDSAAPVAQTEPPRDQRDQRDRQPSNFDRFNGPPTASNGDAPPPRSDAPPRNDVAAMVIPQGTPITVRMIDSVDSETARLGDHFRASIEDPVIVNGQTVIPRGADVSVRLSDDQKSGKISGKTVLTLTISTLTINGREVDVTTGDVQEASSSRGSRSGKVIGGTTALGAIIGAVAGGGKGAAIGAASGAAVGTGGEVMTKGQRVKIPSESRLTFTLSNDVRI